MNKLPFTVLSGFLGAGKKTLNKLKKLFTSACEVNDSDLSAPPPPALEINDFDLEYLCWIVSLYMRIRNVPGHIAEIGIAKGRNTVYFGKLIKQFNDHNVRQYIGFDTFNGFTDESLKNDPQLNEYNGAWLENTKQSVLDRCKDNEVLDVVEIIEGDACITVPDTLKNYQGKNFRPGKGKFALLYIDSNAYEPSIQSMENFLEYMLPGGVIAIDEKLQGGESRAIIDFGKKHNLKVERFGPNEIPMAIVIK